ncbi:MAG: SDR family NAD(P)-dependent oxidoreductase, partial [Sulfurimonas sp.]|nr:SDR family NAD(P)-dependent oxidoreductase [Sulfurimonas sp.]
MKILITGASSGIGKELSKLYATPENNLILLARREDRLYKLKLELCEAKSVEIVVADVSEFDALQEKIRDIGAVDMVILNAGISLGHSLDMTHFKDFK